MSTHYVVMFHGEGGQEDQQVGGMILMPRCSRSGSLNCSDTVKRETPCGVLRTAGTHKHTHVRAHTQTHTPIEGMERQIIVLLAKG